MTLTPGTVTAAELTDMRAHAEVLLTETCDISRPSWSANSIGEPVAGTATVGTAIPCRFVQAGRRMPEAMQLRDETLVQADWNVLLEWDQDVQERDWITHDSVTYSVLATWADETWPILTRAELQVVA